MDFNETFLRLTDHRSDYQEIYRIARDLSGGGRIWLIGGAVFRPLAAAIWGGAFVVPDFDLLFERMPPDALLPAGWTVERNRYGHPKLIRGATEIDVIPLLGIRSVARRGVEPRIENYLAGTPLTIQSIAFDILGRVIIGEVGKQALLDGTVGVNDRGELEDVVVRIGHPAEEYAGTRAASLGFRLDLSPVP